MKKRLLLLVSVAIILTGCTKDHLSNGLDGKMTSVTFTVSVDCDIATKTVADNDGKGTNVNRCIMEIYFQDQLYKRMVEPMTNSGVATFANVQAVAGKQYQILFWVDCGGDGKADKYYSTSDLKTVIVVKEAFCGALAAGRNDELDAFFFSDNYTIPQASGTYSATLKRPFAQLNVITTDVAAGEAIASAEVLPDKVSVSYNAANRFDVATGEISGSELYEYEAPVYGDNSDWEAVKTRGELTLSMDYILALTEKGVFDVAIRTRKGSTEVMSHNLTNLPCQRNYRTNVKGDLLTAGGTWNATVDPIWSESVDTKQITILTY